MQAICDYKGVFMDVECRWPGSVHDSKVFATSKIVRGLENGSLPVTVHTFHDKQFHHQN